MLQTSSFPFQSYSYVETGNLEDARRAAQQNREERRFLSTDRKHPPRVRMGIVRLPSFDAMSVSYGCNMKAESLVAVQNYFLITPLHGELHRNHKQQKTLHNGQATLFSPGDELDLDWFHDTTSLIIRINRNTLHEFAEKVYGLTRPRTQIHLPTYLSLEEGAGLSITSMLQTLVTELDDENSLLSQGVTTKMVSELLLTSLLHSNSDEFKKDIARGKFDNRVPHLQRAVDFIKANLEREISLSELTETSGTCARKLQSEFSKHYGMGPMSYIKQEKLNCLRDALLAANPHEATVGDIAARWGFYHASNLSQIYRKQFGESPSATLNRHNLQVALSPH